MDTLDSTNTSHDPLADAANKPGTYVIYSQEEAFLHMTRKRNEKEQLLYLITDDVLFNIWDGCCLSIDQQYREEYLPYLPHVFDLLCTTTDGLDIFDYLVFIEESEFGTFKGDALSRRRASRVVEILLEYRETIFNNKEQETVPPGHKTTNQSELYPA